MGPWTARLMEVARALGVLALVFLNFGHAPMAAAAGPPMGAWTASWCGAPVGSDAPGDSTAAQCDVCLIGSGLDLPPAPPAPPLRFGGETGGYVLIDSPARTLVRRTGAQPRAPPALV